MSEQEHPAVRANMNSIRYASEGNKDAWLALYAEDAIVHDPVGKSPMDPTGEGHRGKAAIEHFWDTVIGPSSVTIVADKRWISGDRCCCVAQVAHNDMGDGKVTHCDMLALYEVNDEGLITRMAAHWDFDDMMAQIAALQDAG